MPPRYAGIAVKGNKVVQDKGKHIGTWAGRSQAKCNRLYLWKRSNHHSPLPFLQRTYIFTFLLSSRVFMPPHDLLARVGQICLEQRQQLEAGPEKVSHQRVSGPLAPR